MANTNPPGRIRIGRHVRGKGYPVTVDGVLAGYVWPWAARHWRTGDVHDKRPGYSHPTRKAAAQALADALAAGGK